MGLRVSWDEVEHKGTDAGGGVVLHYKDHPFTGVVEEVINGVLIGEAEFFEGHKNGLQRDYHKNGQLKEEYTIRYNKIEGTFTEWDEDGNMVAQTRWKDGVQ